MKTHSTDPRRSILTALGPSRLWWGLVFIAMGVLGILHVVGVVDWNRTVGGWWPVAIIGWAIVEMLSARRFSTLPAIVAAVGLGLLADEQRWNGGGLIWSAVFLIIGVAILSRPHRRKRTDKGNARSAAGAVEPHPVDASARGSGRAV